MYTTELLPVISSVTALLAIIVGPFVTMSVAKKQIDASKTTADLQARANVLSKSRQEWINALRNEIAGFMSCAGHALAVVAAATTNGGDTLSIVKDIRLHFAKTKLLINPEEADHQELMNRMEEITFKFSNLNFDVEQANSELAAVAQRILKREWEVVKTFK